MSYTTYRTFWKREFPVRNFGILHGLSYLWAITNESWKCKDRLKIEF